LAVPLPGNKKIMYKKIIMLLLVTVSSKLLSAQKLTVKDITGNWQISSLITDGQTIPIESDDALRNFMYTQMVTEKGKTDSTNTALTADDSSGVEMSVKIMGMFRKSDLIFKANKTYKFSLSLGGSSKDQVGTWAFNEATQILRITEVRNGKAKKAEIVKVRGSQLLLQMEKDKEEGFLLSKKK
jgi:hypothetical protein